MMKYYRINQIAMAVLGALLLFFGTRTIIDIAFKEHPPEKPGYEVAGDEDKPEADGKPDTAAQLAGLLASGSAEKGAEVAKKCSICHGFDAGAPSPLGPTLHNVVGRKIASVEGFNYSPALKAKEGNWTYENLDAMVHNPQAFAPGTTMAFPGLPDAQDRADVILFLRGKTENPPPLPEAPPPGEKPAAETAEGKDQPAAPAAGAEILALLPAADAKKGEADAAVCKVCHGFEKGAPSPLGPTLYGVVGRKIASVEGFNYSPALKGKEGDWTYENIDAFIHEPQTFAPGTLMAFPGMPDAKKRANVIAFLRTKSDDPVPLPEAAAGEEAKPEEAPAAAPEEEAPQAEKAAPEEPAAAEEPAEEPAAEEEAPAAEPEEPAATEEEPAAEPEEPAATEEEPAAEPEAPAATEPGDFAPEDPAPAEEPAAEEPEAVMEEEAEETVVVPPTVSKDAPSEPHMGEPPSPSQPQPVYPDGEPGDAADEPAGEAVMEEETMEETIAVPPTVSEDAPSEPHMGEPPSPSQPQPVYPDGEPGSAMEAEPDSTGSAEPAEDSLSSQPQPVYPDGPPDAH